MYVNENECNAVGLAPKEVAKIARRLERALSDANKLGIILFGGSGTGTLRASDGGDARLILAILDEGHVDGGDGAEHLDENGLWRGE